MESTSYKNLSNDLTREEILSLNKLKEYFATQYLDYPFDVYNNEFLIRFLRACRFNIPKTYEMFTRYLRFSDEYDIPNIDNVSFPNNDKLKLFFPHGFHKTTKDGYPIFIQSLGELKIDDINKLLPDKMMNKYIISIFERLRKKIFPKLTRHTGKKIDKLFCVVDWKGWTTSWMSKKVFYFVYAQLNIAENYYPGIWDQWVFVNCGWLFRAVWGACKYFYSVDTRNKIVISGFNYSEKLLDKVNPLNLPKFFGGECNCDPYGCIFSDAGPWREEFKRINTVSYGTRAGGIDDDDDDDASVYKNNPNELSWNKKNNYEAEL